MYLIIVFLIVLCNCILHLYLQFPLVNFDCIPICIPICIYFCKWVCICICLRFVFVSVFVIVLSSWVAAAAPLSSFTTCQEENLKVSTSTGLRVEQQEGSYGV